MRRRSILTGTVLLLLSYGMQSCRSANDVVDTGAATVTVSFKGSSFTSETSLGSQASLKNIAKEKISGQRKEIVLNDDYSLVANLEQDEDTGQLSGKMTTLAATDSDPGMLGARIRYKVVVYDSNGNYITEQDYVSGKEKDAPAITQLNGDSTYTFIVYSTGSVSELPPVQYTNPAVKTLSSAFIDNVSGSSDLMYFSKTMKVTGNNTNYLDVILKHKFSQITVSIDVTPTTWYTITNISEVNITPHHNTARLQLADGSTTASGLSTTGSIISFPGFNAKTVEAKPVLINTAQVSDGIFTIKEIAMKHQNDSPVRHQNITLEGLSITPGYKYNLKITFQPTDKYLMYRGYQAVRLSGLIWMRHNLGANMSANPDIPSQEINGDYYQFGRIDPVANASTFPNAIPKWNITSAPNNAWNTGDFLNAVKTDTDPCPAGWRVPTNRELNVLDTGTSKSTTGTVRDLATNYSAAKILTSAFNPNIKMTIPFSGYRSASDGALLSRGTQAGLWSVSPNFSNATQAVQWVLYDPHPVNVNFQWRERAEGSPVRCIAISPLER
ncbi:hypothetical protein KRE47_09035 [Elizabethkingia meningoseptica]|uniref:FISUMP domain-containing protein n=1 Tax=Elizabethkingia meningoseptica TaxID=238 RepID=UPI0023AEE975|nr:FISUMP domain-containing protein [Elizabethkingia meningoseptica]MDE5469182.1 hypothetical protein [Elizabethkingia meningoseptica]MDE5475096.1 hypothetical protein [Elizabethkingia meningoseptica]MDE5478529.1 hypothetical protein [Elizabethkingia meningoseptica]MDE5486223.1 hypothetical protein [Elizabethkingia meningoseptica]MDE5501479.1 hypothetical protein [Elizabethkingia meningoseptica]